MAGRRVGAGVMRHKIHVQRQVEGDDGYGGVIVGWEAVTTVSAHLHPLRGGEQVMASRLAGVAPFIITIRSSEITRQMTPAWRLVDARAGNRPDDQPRRVFDIKAISDPDGKGAWLECLCEEIVS